MKNTRKPGDGERRPAKRDGRPAGRDGKPAGRAGKPAFKKSSSAPSREKNPAHVAVTGEGERISKIMARAGVASRRDCERMILEGRVTLNGTVLTSPAINCQPSDKIEVDGQPIGTIERTRLWIYYKPAGLVTTNFDPEGRPTVFEKLPAELPRVISVGRLDINTEGLLLLTNDGGLARMLELPTTGWLRRYRVRAHGSIDQAKLDSLKEGIAVDGVFYGAIEATLDREQGHNVWITMGLREGKNREIKNVLGALGLDVNRLIRISYGPFQLGELEDGQVVEVKSRTLRDQLGPRLIADANANFEAPIHNQPKSEAVDDDEPDAAREWASARPKRESREDRRERDLARIDTKRPDRKSGERGEGRFGDRPDRKFGDKPDRKGGDRPRGRDRDRDEDFAKPKRPPLGTARTANVWMAPGARPVATKQTKEEPAAGREQAKPKRRILRLKKDQTSEASPAKALKPKREVRGAKPGGDARPARSKAGERMERPSRSASGKPSFEQREGSGERGRFRPERTSEGKAGAERPARARKPAGDGPAAARSERPARSFDGPKRERTGSDRPRGGKPGGGKPASGKPSGDRPGRGGPAGKGKGGGADRRR